MLHKIEEFQQQLENKDYSLLESTWDSFGTEEIFVVKKEILSRLSHSKINRVYKEISMFNEYLANDIFKGVFEYDQARSGIDTFLSDFMNFSKSKERDDFSDEGKSSEDSDNFNENTSNINEDAIILIREIVSHLNELIDFNLSLRLERLQKTVRGRLDYLEKFKKELEQRNDLDKDTIDFLIKEEWKNINRLL